MAKMTEEEFRKALEERMKMRKAEFEKMVPRYRLTGEPIPKEVLLKWERERESADTEKANDLSNTENRSNATNEIKSTDIPKMKDLEFLAKSGSRTSEMGARR